MKRSSFIIAFGAGLLPGYPNWIEGADKLYTLQRSTARDHANLHSLLFQEARIRFSYIMLSTDGEVESTEKLAQQTSLSNDLQLTYEVIRKKQENRTQDTVKKGRHSEISDNENVLTWRFLKIAAELDLIVRGKSLDPLQGIRIAFDAQENYRHFGRSFGSHSVSGTNDSNIQDDDLTSQLTFEQLCRRNAFGDCETSGIFKLIMNSLPPPISRVPSSLSVPNTQSISDDLKPELWIADGFLLDVTKQSFLPADGFLGGLATQSCVRPLPTSFLHDIASRIIPKSMLDITRLDIDLERSQVRLECVTGARGKTDSSIKSSLLSKLFVLSLLSLCNQYRLSNILSLPLFEKIVKSLYMTYYILMISILPYISAILMGYGLKDGPRFQALNEQWESLLLTVVRPLRQYWPDIYVYVNAFRSRGSCSSHKAKHIYTYIFSAFPFCQTQDASLVLSHTLSS